MSASVVKEPITLRLHDQTGRTARQFVLVLRRWRVTELVERVAARSGRDTELVLIREPRSVRIEVYDGSQVAPASAAEVIRRAFRGS